MFSLGVMFPQTSHWHTTVPVGGGIHAINKAQADVTWRVIDIPSAAVRPLISRLNCDKFQTDFDIACPNWYQGLTEVLQGLREIL
jgi:dTDP-4-dehydrorhamnose reductase